MQTVLRNNLGNQLCFAGGDAVLGSGIFQVGVIAGNVLNNHRTLHLPACQLVGYGLGQFSFNLVSVFFFYALNGYQNCIGFLADITLIGHLAYQNANAIFQFCTDQGVVADNQRAFGIPVIYLGDLTFSADAHFNAGIHIQQHLIAGSGDVTYLVIFLGDIGTIGKQAHTPGGQHQRGGYADTACRRQNLHPSCLGCFILGLAALNIFNHLVYSFHKVTSNPFSCVFKACLARLASISVLCTLFFITLAASL